MGLDSVAVCCCVSAIGKRSESEKQDGSYLAVLYIHRESRSRSDGKRDLQPHARLTSANTRKESFFSYRRALFSIDEAVARCVLLLLLDRNFEEATLV